MCFLLLFEHSVAINAPADCLLADFRLKRKKWCTFCKCDEMRPFCLLNVSLYMPQQRICQRKRACGEEAGVPEAPEAATDRARAHRVLGVDLQSRSDSSLKQWESWHACVCCVRKSWQIDRKSLSPLFLSLFFSLQRRCCWRRRMRLQRRSPRWTVRGTRGNRTFQVKIKYLSSASLWSITAWGTLSHFHLVIAHVQH